MSKESLGIVKKAQLGGDIDAYCGKCKEMREHVIAAMSPAGQVERVQCRTCQSNHLYREKKAPTASSRSTTRASRKDSASALAETGPLRMYSMQDRFAVGDFVQHPKFGTGQVIEVRLGKIDVKFGRELKTLVHGA